MLPRKNSPPLTCDRYLGCACGGGGKDQAGLTPMKISGQLPYGKLEFITAGTDRCDVVTLFVSRGSLMFLENEKLDYSLSCAHCGTAETKHVTSDYFALSIPKGS